MSVPNGGLAWRGLAGANPPDPFRARYDAQVDLMRAWHRCLKPLLRHGIVYRWEGLGLLWCRNW